VQILDAVIADGPNVDLRCHPEIQDLGDHIGRLKIEDIFRKGRRQRLPQLAHIIGRGEVPVLQRHEDHAVIDADRRAVGEGQIVKARRQADVVDDQLAFACRNNLADLVLDSLKDLLGLLDAGARRSADMKLDLPAIDDRKEVAPDKDIHQSAKAEDRDCDNRHDDPAGQQSGEELRITIAQTIKATLEAMMEPREPASFSAVTFALQQEPDRDRRQCPREAIGSEHCEHDGEAERGEQIFRRSLEKDNRGENAANRQGRDQGRHGNAGGAVQRGLRQWLFFFGQQAMRVLDRHRRIIDQDPYRQRQSAQCHCIERIAEEIEHDQR
jgi:hypothetical protein